MMRACTATQRATSVHTPRATRSVRPAIVVLHPAIGPSIMSPRRQAVQPDIKPSARQAFYGRLLAWATGVALFAWFVFIVRGGLASWFDNDDLMNLHYYWSKPWSALLKANLEFWSSYYRPAGGLFYRSIYAIWGFHPLPFHAVALVLLSVNFALLAIVVWQLTKS